MTFSKAWLSLVYPNTHLSRTDCVFGSNRFILPDTDVQLYFDATKNNKDIILTMTFNNLSNEPRTITCKITGKVEYYTGATRTQFSFITHDVSLQALESESDYYTQTKRNLIHDLPGKIKQY